MNPLIISTGRATMPTPAYTKKMNQDIMDATAIMYTINVGRTVNVSVPTFGP